MNSPETPDPIDKLLREQNAHVADDGFTQRVIGALPGRSSRWPRIILLAVVAAGTGIAIGWMPWKSLPPFDYTQLFSSDSKMLSAWTPFIVVGVVLGSAVLAATRREN